MGAIPACNCNKKPGEEEITFPDKDSKDIEKVKSEQKMESPNSERIKEDTKVQSSNQLNNINTKINSDTNNNTSSLVNHNNNVNNVSKHNQSSFILPPIQNDNGNNLLDNSSSLDNIPMEVYEDKLEVEMKEEKRCKDDIIENDNEVHITNEDNNSVDNEKGKKEIKIEETIKEENKEEESNEEEKKNDNEILPNEENSIKETEIRNKSIYDGGSEMISSLNHEIGIFVRKFNNNITSGNSEDIKKLRQHSYSFDEGVKESKELTNNKMNKSFEYKYPNKEEEEKFSVREGKDDQHEDLCSEYGDEDVKEKINLPVNTNEEIIQNIEVPKQICTPKKEEIQFENLRYEEKDNNIEDNMTKPKTVLKSKRVVKKEDMCNDVEQSNTKEKDKRSQHTNEGLKSLITQGVLSSGKDNSSIHTEQEADDECKNLSKSFQKEEENIKEIVPTTEEPTSGMLTKRETNTNIPQQTLSNQPHNESLIDKKIIYEVSSPISQSFINQNHTRFDIQSTKAIQENVFSISPSVQPSKDTNPLNIDISIHNENNNTKNELLQQTFDVEILPETTANVNNISTTLTSTVANAKPNRRKVVTIKEEKSKKTSKSTKSGPLKRKPSKIQPVNKFFLDIIFHSELKKYIQNDYDIKAHGGLLYAKRFCALKKTQFEYYTSKEQFILLQKPTCIIQNDKILRAKIVKMKDKRKHFEIVYYSSPENHNNLNATNANVINEESEDEKETKVIFAAEKEEIALYWVSLLNQIINSNKTNRN